MLSTLPIAIPKEPLQDLCQRYHVQKLSLFGSVLRDDFGAESDVDFLVEFEKGKTPGYLGLAGMEIELTEMIGRKADVRTPNELSRYFRDRVVSGALPVYVCN
jgi:predicted nucleotidyltransferase